MLPSLLIPKIIQGSSHDNNAATAIVCDYTKRFYASVAGWLAGWLAGCFHFLWRSHIFLSILHPAAAIRSVQGNLLASYVLCSAMPSRPRHSVKRPIRSWPVGKRYKPQNRLDSFAASCSYYILHCSTILYSSLSTDRQSSPASPPPPSLLLLLLLLLGPLTLFVIC